MSDAYEQSESSRRAMEAEWRQAQGEWRDGTTEQFARQHWGPLEAQTNAHLEALSELLDVLRTAQREVDSA